MLNRIAPNQASSQLRDEQSRLSTRITAITAAVIFLAATAAAWHYHQSQPINDQQLTTLSSLVAKAAEKSGSSRQKIWSNMHKRFEIRRASQLRRGDFDDALEYLTEASKQ
ncbi:MAG: hypothetical protein HQL98_15465 [Magnetococcales bacterium]|nr:hypothetical protein [Magnetococcales bacterium]